MNPYIYMFIRGDLSIPQQIVQTAHAVDEIGKRYQSNGTNHMVLCNAHDENSLLEISNWLHLNLIDHELFYEPDIAAYTAIATQPLIGDSRRPLRRFRLKR